MSKRKILLEKTSIQNLQDSTNSAPRFYKIPSTPNNQTIVQKQFDISHRHQTARWKWHFKNRSRPNTTYTLIFTYTTLFRTHVLCATSIKEGVAVVLACANHKSSGHVCVLHPSMCAAYSRVCVTRSSSDSAVYGRKCTRLPAPQRVPISFMFLDPYLVFLILHLRWWSRINGRVHKHAIINQ